MSAEDRILEYPILLIYIFSFLDHPKDLSNISRTCKLFKDLTSSSYIWRLMALRYFPKHFSNASLQFSKSYKKKLSQFQPFHRQLLQKDLKTINSLQTLFDWEIQNHPENRHLTWKLAFQHAKMFEDWKLRDQNSSAQNLLPKRSLCENCGRPLNACLCSGLLKEKINNEKLKVFILLHPHCPTNTGTVQLLERTLKYCKVVKTINAEHSELLELYDSKVPCLLLFPSPRSQSLNSLTKIQFLQSIGECTTQLNILVIDGTWRQAKYLYKWNPILHRLPHFHLEPAQPALFHQLKKEPKETCVSTLEAVALAMIQLNRLLLDGSYLPENFYQMMITPLQTLISIQKDFEFAIK